MTHLRELAILLLALSVSSPAWADGAKPKLTAHFLSAVELDPAHTLPSPPHEGTPAALREMNELKAIIAARTPERLAQAQFDDVTKDASIFADVIGRGFDLKALPLTAKLMSEVRNEEKVAADAAKARFKRQRPWIVDDTLASCSREDEPLTGYPSGHATMGYSMAIVLAEIAPDRAQALLDRASVYAESRLVCGMHRRADIVAGQALGTAVASDLLHNPHFRSELDAATAELRTAKLIP